DLSGLKVSEPPASLFSRTHRRDLVSALRMPITIRPETPADFAAIHEVNCCAFEGDAEAKLVAALRDGGYVRVSLVAEAGGTAVGHILFSDLPIITPWGPVAALSLAPLAVRPEYQNRGIGSELVRGGMATCRDAGHRIVVV